MCNHFHFSGREVGRLVQRLRIFPIAEEAQEVWPTKSAPIVTLRHDTSLAFEMMPWGMKPEWMKKNETLLFAQGETVHSKATWQYPFRENRVLIPATNFWEGACFGRSDGEPMAFGGVWGSYRDPEGRWREGFVMVSTPACEAVLPYNTRQPLILPESAWETWIDPQRPIADVLPLIQTWAELVQVAPEPPKKVKAKPVKVEAEEQMELEW